jgi:hypothetical protein
LRPRTAGPSPCATIRRREWSGAGGEGRFLDFDPSTCIPSPNHVFAKLVGFRLFFARTSFR